MTAIELDASFDHAGLQLSVLVPADWEAEELADNKVRFFAPPEPTLDDYRPTMSFIHGQPEGFGDDWFARFAKQSVERLAGTYEGFELIGTEQYMLSSLAPVHVTRYRWEPEPGMDFSQIQALVPVDAFRMYLVNAATRHPLEQRDLPVFEAVVRSMRVLSTPP